MMKPDTADARKGNLNGTGIFSVLSHIYVRYEKMCYNLQEKQKRNRRSKQRWDSRLEQTEHRIVRNIWKRRLL